MDGVEGGMGKEGTFNVVEEVEVQVLVGTYLGETLVVGGWNWPGTDLPESVRTSISTQVHPIPTPHPDG